MERATEGAATIRVERPETVSKDMEVFYNPVMAFNRTLSVILLKSLGKAGLRVCDPMAGSGVRSLRFLKELPPGVISELVVNDLSRGFIGRFEENARLSGVELKEGVAVENREASSLLLGSRGFDYVDVDPFGSPNPFLDAAVRKVHRGGVLAVTATDTAPLCGTYPKACRRKYWATPRRDVLMHEAGLRILVRKCQLVAAQYDKALTPILAYSKDHYFRVFFGVAQGKQRVDKILDDHGFLGDAGPLWLGPLGDKRLLARMSLVAEDSYPDAKGFLDTLAAEAALDVPGFFDVHEAARKLKSNPPRMEDVLGWLHEAGFRAVRTHISGTGVRADCDEDSFLDAVRGGSS
ncbi:MAG: tRNA (guanine(26)-N(2))-dimethyltransferase [Candidatus Woesearchaeota archaeon]